MFYIFHGEDSHSQLDALHKVRAKLRDPAMLDLNTTKFDKPVPLSELQNACQAVPFLAKVRLVIATNFLSNLEKTAVKQLATFLKDLPDFTRLFFLESKTLRPTHPIVKLAESHERGYTKQFNALEGRALTQWIQKQVEIQVL